MKRTKLFVALVLALTLGLGVFSAPVFAADGTQGDPYLGANDYGSDDGGNIVIHKLDIAQFERAKTAELGSKVTYAGNAPTGELFDSADVIGYYTTEADPTTKVDVLLSDLAPLSNIMFYVEQVELKAAAAPGSNNPADYDPISNGIADYVKTADGTGEISLTNLPKGYYRISEQANETGEPLDSTTKSFIVSVPMVDPADDTKLLTTVHVYPKNRAAAKPVIVKEPPELDDFNGNKLSWTIKSEVPKNIGETMGSQTYEITDTMSKGIQYAGNLKVYYNSGSGATQEELVSGTDYETAVKAGDTTLTITLKDDGYAKLAGAITDSSFDLENDKYILYITYDSVVNISRADLEAASQPNNKVVLNFTNNDGTVYTDDPGPVPVEDYAILKITKVDGNNEKITLENAKFKIYTALSGNDVDTNSALKDAAGTELEFTTDQDGVVLYAGLSAGTYYIKETQAPDKYQKLNTYDTVEITQSDVEGNETKSVTVKNYLNNGLTLPNTGGPGTIIFCACGLALIIAAGVILLVSKRRSRSGKRN